MQRETLQVLFLPYLMSVLWFVRPLWRGRRQADNTFPPIPAAADQVLLRWPPRSPDLTPWGYVKDSVFLPPLPQDLPELRRRIIAVVSEIDRDVLHGGNGLSDWRLPCHTRRTHRALKRYAKGTWRVSLCICSSHVTILSVNKVCRFYEIRQGIMNNLYMWLRWQDN